MTNTEAIEALRSFALDSKHATCTASERRATCEHLVEFAHLCTAAIEGDELVAARVASIDIGDIEGALVTMRRTASQEIRSVQAKALNRNQHDGVAVCAVASGMEHRVADLSAALLAEWPLTREEALERVACAARAIRRLETVKWIDGQPVSLGVHGIVPDDSKLSRVGRGNRHL